MELKANELRMFNFVKQLNKVSGNDNCKVISNESIICLDTLNKFGATIYNIEHYEPIPLTEEWIFKFGYDLITENHYAVLGHLIWKVENRFYCDKNGMQLKHVHQLQNLYFALTNKELEIKM